MIKLLPVILTLSLPATSFAQAPLDCNFLKDLKFKNGTDTIVVKATYVDRIEVHTNGNAFNSLKKQGKVKTTGYDEQLTFKPINCKESYTAPDGSGDLNGLEFSNIGKTFYFTLVAFERKDGYSKGVPFFVITKVSAKSGNKP
jgi:hypothetical protein